MPSARISTFISPSSSMSSLSHSMKVRSSIAALWIGTSLVEPVLGQYIAADMLRQVAREGEQLRRRSIAAVQYRLVRIEPRFDEALDRHLAAPAAPASCRRAAAVTSSLKAQRLADLAHCAARAVMDHRRGNARAPPRVAAIDILHHLLAPFVFEIDIDVGRLAAFFGEKAGEEEVVRDRIDRGDFEQVADERIGGRPAPLAKDRRVLRAREMDDVVDGQEIAGKVAFADQPKLLVEHACQRSGNPFGVERVRAAVHHQMFKPALRFPAFGHRLVRIFIAAGLRARKSMRSRIFALSSTASGQMRNRRLISCGRFQMAFAIGAQQAAGVV